MNKVENQVKKTIPKILFVCSSGGHLLQLYRLKSALNNSYEETWITFEKSDSCSILKGKKKYWGFFPTNRNYINLFRNSILAIRVFFVERPTTVISTGAGLAIPFLLLARFFCKNSIYIESFARAENLSLTGKVVYPIVTHFFVQSEMLSIKYKKAKYRGGIY